MPRQPIYGEESGTCTTCGRGYPVSYLILTRRYGWQCLPGTGTEGCYDGPVQRDELRYIPRPYEGVRRSIAPIYDLATMGFEPGDRIAAETRFRDHGDGIIYELSLNPPFPTFTPSSDQTSFSHGGWEVSSDFRLWIVNGLGGFGDLAPDAYSYIPVPANVSLSLDDAGALVYGQI